MTRIFVAKAVTVALVLAAIAYSPLSAGEPTVDEDYNNEICPVMGNPINPDLSFVYEDNKIFLCCPCCEKKFRKNPKKYLRILEQEKEAAGEDEW